jgi:CBS domain-containing protein
MSLKDSFVEYRYKEILDSKIGEMFDFENTLPAAVNLSDNVIGCINVLKDDEQCQEGALVKSHNKYVGVITGRELTTALLSEGAKKFVKHNVGDYFSSDYIAITEDTTLFDFIQKMQSSRRGFGLVIRDGKPIGKLSNRDIVALYPKINSGATLGDFLAHRMISVSPSTTIKEAILLMMRYQIRKIFIKDKLCPFISERNVLGLVASCASKKE